VASPVFVKAAYTVLPGNISDIIETSNGYHIIKVVKRFRETKPLQDFRRPYTIQLKKIKDRRARKALFANLKEAEDYKIIEFWKTNSGPEE
jgi:parvulin-like peptidyl-prolyl isomerase